MAGPQLVLDLTGTFVFALSGALAAVRERLDVFGVVVVATVTAVGGGIVRDVLLGNTPPTSLRTWYYLTASLAAAVAVFLWHPRIALLWRPIVVLDAAGLGLFTVAGTRLALAHHVGAAGAIAIGILTGIGGGVIRDVLLREIPLVLRRDIYALAAAGGAIVIVVVDRLADVNVGWQIGAAAVVFVVRVLAARRHWSMPTARGTSAQ